MGEEDSGVGERGEKRPIIPETIWSSRKRKTGVEASSLHRRGNKMITENNGEEQQETKKNKERGREKQVDGKKENGRRKESREGRET